MKVIFLDFDGVIVTAHDRYTTGDQFAVFNLNRITDETKAKLVISSSWRIGQSVGTLKTMLSAWGVTGEVIDKTPHLNFGDVRGLEIQKWLDEHKVDGFVILDDDSDMAHLGEYLVQTHAHHGLDETHLTKAIEILESLSGEKNGDKK